MMETTAKFAGYLGAGICILTALAFSNLQQPMWPFPGLYLMEIAFCGLVAAAAAGRHERANAQLEWVLSGVLLAFTVLGALTLGPLLAPGFLALLTAAVLRSWGQRRQLLTGVLTSVITACVQGGIILLMVPLIA